MFDITRGCFEKSLFDYLENKLLNIQTKGFTLYKKYYTSVNIVSNDANISSLERKPGFVDAVYKHLYKFEDSNQAPTGFTICSRSDLHRLAGFLNIDIIIYINTLSDVWFSSQRSIGRDVPTEYFLLQSNKILCLFPEENRFEDVIKSITTSYTHVNSSFQESFEKIMQFPALSQYNNLDSSQFTLLKDELSFLYKIDSCIIVFFYAGCNRKTRTKVNLHSFVQSFIQLGREPRTYQDILDSTFLVIFANFIGCPELPYVNHLRKQLLNVLPHCSDSNMLPVHECNPVEKIKLNKELVAERRVVASRKRKLKSQKKKSKLKKMCYNLLELSPPSSDTEQESASFSYTKHCKCTICSSDNYNNMSSCGQETLCTIKLSSYELLHMLGIATPSNKQIIEKLCEYSIASVDIESMTISSDNKSFDSYDDTNDYSCIGGPGRTINKIQKPVMIAHADCLEDTQVLSLQDYLDEGSSHEKESNIYRMMESYFNCVVLNRHKRIIDLKKSLAEPLLEYLKAYNREHVSFCQEFCNVSSAENTLEDMLPTYKHTLPGLLEEKLVKLINHYVIFSFYGSGYDMIILEAYLIPLMFEQSLKPKIDKKGNKISIITLKNGIQFRDITKLLAPSTNLRSFGKLFNLDIEKGIFPFKILTSVESLMQPCLPTDIKLWQSELSGNGNKITSKEIEEAIEFYRQSNFQNVGEYLQHYLVLDVQILQQATNLWRKRLFEIIGIDFVDVHKYTISSLSNFAGANKLASHLKQGWFFPNNSQVYSLLKQGMRG